MTERASSKGVQIKGRMSQEREEEAGYLKAFVSSLAAVHHGGEGERSDQTTQEVLQTQAQHSQT